MCPKSLRESPPSLAIAPTIWRGSTLWRLPTAIRYVAIGTSVRPRGRRSARSGAVATGGAVTLRTLVADRTGAPRPGSRSSGVSPWATTASAAATSTSGTSCSRT